ncbi:uncharacterized protein LOC106169807 isoform X2 [Lingula anatina]|uniref:Uncharacterized protein LOC106169807 isoform X2 n=1 Tax=Lingula anatina TaxID=7574 RepID=A0A1S3J4W2_LINAN|nr:uncharacterized protein LOC106169807 isoform X2 [Lingula anatina]|eukprot:XP_013404879.1 uncharacterized protein LOC106169807 isoform X2 [Lingula anatina]
MAGAVKTKWWLSMILCLLSQQFHPVFPHVHRPERKVLNEANDNRHNNKRVAVAKPTKTDSFELQGEPKVHHRERRALGAVFKFVLSNFWDDIVCLGLNLAQTFQCGSLTPGTCQRLDNMDNKRNEIALKVNQTLDEEITWSVLNSTNDRALTNLYLIGKELEIIASSNIRLMEILRTLDAVEENSTVYVPDDLDTVTEQKIRFRVNLEKYLNGIQGTLDGIQNEIAVLKRKDFVYLAMMTAIPLVAMHTGLITTSARTALLSRSQNYQVVEFYGKQGSYQLASNPQGKMFIVQENPKNLGKLKVYAKLDSNGKVGKFWKFMMPAGQRAATNSFLESVDFKRAKQVATLQRLEPDYLQKLKKTGHLPAFLRSTDGLSPQKFDEFVNTAKTKDPKVMFKADNVDASIPKWMRQTLSSFDPSDVASVRAYNRLKQTNPDLLSDLQKKGKLGDFIKQSKGLNNADFDAYVKKVSSANADVDGLKNFDFKAPAKKVKWYSWQKMKSGWRSFSNKNLFTFRGRKVKVGKVLNMGNVGSALNVGLCIFMSVMSTINVNKQIDEIEERINNASAAVDLKLEEMKNLTAFEVEFFGLVKNNFYGIVSMFDTSEDSTGIAADPNCQDTLCIFLREAASLNPIKNYVSAWPNASITNTTILDAQMFFLNNLTSSKYVMVQLYRQSEMVAQVMTWVGSQLSITRMMEIATTLSRPFANKYDLLRLIAKAFPDIDDYTGYPLKCIRSGSIASDQALDAWMTSNQVKSLDPRVSNFIDIAVEFGKGVNDLLELINRKIDDGSFPANGCGGGHCTREDILTEIATKVIPAEATYDGVNLAPYRQKTIVCPNTVPATTTQIIPTRTVPRLPEKFLDRLRERLARLGRMKTRFNPFGRK